MMQRAQDESAKLSVQQWIDQTPAWPDGTPVNAQPMTSMQTRIWALAAAGKFFEDALASASGSLIDIASPGPWSE